MKKTGIIALFCSGLILLGEPSAKGQVAINSDGSSAEAGSVLDVKSTTGGILVPRMTMAQRNAIGSPPSSLLIYQTDNTSGFYYNSGTPSSPVWKRLQVDLSTGQWMVSGSDIYYNLGNVGIGTSSPSFKLDIAGNARISSSGAPSVLNIDAHNSTSNIAKLIFQNTAGTGDYQIMGDGGDIFWQGGGSRNLQMGAYHGMDFMGARLTLSPIPFTAGTLNDYNSRFLNATDAIGLIIQGNSGQTKDLLQWRNSSSTILGVVNPSGNMALGSSTFDGTNPEKLKVDAGTSTINAISGYGNINSYLQLNIANGSNGNAASSDIVATANNGSESAGYVDIGINGQNYNQSSFSIGAANDAYLYSVGVGGSGGNLSIGTASSGKVIKFHTGGTTTSEERMRIDGTGKVGIGTTSPNSAFEINGATTIDKVSSSPTCANGQTVVYTKGNYYVIMYNDGGTYKYRYLTLNSTNATWTYSTTAP